MSMALGKVFEPFVEQRPICVMARGVLEHLFNQEIPRSLLRGYLAKGRGGRNRGVSPTRPFRLIPRSLLRGGFIAERIDALFARTAKVQ